MRLWLRMLLAVLAVGILFFVWRGLCTDTPEQEPSSAETVDMTSEPAADAPVKKSLDQEQLLTGIRQCMEKNPTNYAVYVEFPDTEYPPLIWQSKPMRSASLIKVFLLAKVMDMEKEGRLQQNQLLTITEKERVGGAGSLCGRPAGSRISLQDVLYLMITESDNTATNMIIDLIGMAEVNLYIQQQGYSDTRLQRCMMDQKAAAAGRENYTSVRDLGLFFHRLCHGQCVGGDYDRQMIEILLQQTDRECFPTALPQARIAHKTGELAGLYDDAGIIYAPAANYILCIMDDHMDSRTENLQTMRAIASYVGAFAGSEL